MTTEELIEKYRESEKEHHAGQINNGIERYLFAQTISENLYKAENKDDFEKGFGKDLQQKFPNGGWRTVSGAKVFINNGKVIAGLDKFNGMIDEFFKQKEQASKPKELTKEDVAGMRARARELNEIKGGFYSKLTVAAEKELNGLMESLNNYAKERLDAIKKEAPRKADGSLDWNKMNGEDKGANFGKESREVLKTISDLMSEIKTKDDKKVTDVLKENKYFKADEYYNEDSLKQVVDLDELSKKYPDLDISVKDEHIVIESKHGGGKYAMPITTIVGVSEGVEKSDKFGDTKTMSLGGLKNSKAFTATIEAIKSGTINPENLSKDLGAYMKYNEESWRNELLFEEKKKELKEKGKAIDEKYKRINNEYYSLNSDLRKEKGVRRRAALSESLRLIEPEYKKGSDERNSLYAEESNLGVEEREKEKEIQEKHKEAIEAAEKYRDSKNNNILLNLVNDKDWSLANRIFESDEFASTVKLLTEKRKKESKPKKSKK